MICSHSVVPERGMPTMKTGAGSVLAARGPRRSAPGESGDGGVDEGAVAVAREGLAARQQPVARRQWAKARAGSFCRDQNLARS